MQSNLKPNEFNPCDLPSIWKRGLQMQAQIDAPMHLIILGYLKGITTEFVHTWLRKQDKYSYFMRRAENRLSGLLKFKLSWLKMLPYKGNHLGGWVSENYVSFSRVCKWFYMVLDDLKPDKEPFRDPDLPQSQWKGDDNRKWLKTRGLPSDGSATEVRVRVAAYTEKTEIPP